MFTLVDKKKALDWITALQTHPGTDINSEELNSATKIIRTSKKTKDSTEFNTSNVKLDQDKTEPQFSVRKSSIDEEDPMRAIDTAADEWRKERKENEVPQKVETPKLSVSESVEPTGNKYIDSLIRLATRNSDDQKHRVQAMRAIGGNLAKLRSAMSLQRKYDQGTVKQLVDLAQGLMNDLNMDELTRGEVKRLTNLVAKGAGKESIMESAKKVYDMMVDHELKHLDKLLRKQLQVSVPKLNSSGVPVQGRMDADGILSLRLHLPQPTRIATIASSRSLHSNIQNQGTVP